MRCTAAGSVSLEKHGNRLAVGRVEGDGLGQADERGQRLVQALDPAMRHGDALAQRCRAQPLTREQAIEHDRAGQSVMVFKK